MRSRRDENGFPTPPRGLLPLAGNAGGLRTPPRWTAKRTAPTPQSTPRVAAGTKRLVSNVAQVARVSAHTEAVYVETATTQGLRVEVDGRRNLKAPRAPRIAGVTSNEYLGKVPLSLVQYCDTNCAAERQNLLPGPQPRWSAQLPPRNGQPSPAACATPTKPSSTRTKQETSDDHASMFPGPADKWLAVCIVMYKVATQWMDMLAVVREFLALSLLSSIKVYSPFFPRMMDGVIQLAHDVSEKMGVQASFSMERPSCTLESRLDAEAATLWQMYGAGMGSAWLRLAVIYTTSMLLTGATVMQSGVVIRSVTLSTLVLRWGDLLAVQHMQLRDTRLASDDALNRALFTNQRYSEADDVPVPLWNNYSRAAGGFTGWATQRLCYGLASLAAVLPPKVREIVLIPGHGSWKDMQQKQLDDENERQKNAQNSGLEAERKRADEARWPDYTTEVALSPVALLGVFSAAVMHTHFHNWALDMLLTVLMSRDGSDEHKRQRANLIRALLSWLAGLQHAEMPAAAVVAIWGFLEAHTDRGHPKEEDVTKLLTEHCGGARTSTGTQAAALVTLFALVRGLLWRELETKPAIVKKYGGRQKAGHSGAKLVVEAVLGLQKQMRQESLKSPLLQLLEQLAAGDTVALDGALALASSINALLCAPMREDDADFLEPLLRADEDDKGGFRVKLAMARYAFEHYVVVLPPSATAGQPKTTVKGINDLKHLAELVTKAMQPGGPPLSLGLPTVMDLVGDKQRERFAKAHLNIAVPLDMINTVASGGEDANIPKRMLASISNIDIFCAVQRQVGMLADAASLRDKRSYEERKPLLAALQGYRPRPCLPPLSPGKGLLARYIMKVFPAAPVPAQLPTHESTGMGSETGGGAGCSSSRADVRSVGVSPIAASVAAPLQSAAAIAPQYGRHVTFVRNLWAAAGIEWRSSSGHADVRSVATTTTTRSPTTACVAAPLQSAAAMPTENCAVGEDMEVDVAPGAQSSVPREISCQDDLLLDLENALAQMGLSSGGSSDACVGSEYGSGGPSGEGSSGGSSDVCMGNEYGSGGPSGEGSSGGGTLSMLRGIGCSSPVRQGSGSQAEAGTTMLHVPATAAAGTPDVGAGPSSQALTPGSVACELDPVAKLKALTGGEVEVGDDPVKSLASIVRFCSGARCDLQREVDAHINAQASKQAQLCGSGITVETPQLQESGGAASITRFTAYNPTLLDSDLLMLDEGSEEHDAKRCRCDS